MGIFISSLRKIVKLHRKFELVQRTPMSKEATNIRRCRLFISRLPFQVICSLSECFPLRTVIFVPPQDVSLFVLYWKGQCLQTHELKTASYLQLNSINVVESHPLPPQHITKQSKTKLIYRSNPFFLGDSCIVQLFFKLYF